VAAVMCTFTEVYYIYIYGGLQFADVTCNWTCERATR